MNKGLWYDNKLFLNLNPTVRNASALTFHYTGIKILKSFPRQPGPSVVASPANQLCLLGLHINRKTTDLAVEATTLRKNRTLKEAKLSLNMQKKEPHLKEEIASMEHT